MAAVAMVTQPQLLLAADSTIPSSALPRMSEATPQDVALADGGVLTGQVVDSSGNPVSMVPVTLNTQGQQIARVHTDQQGTFRVASLQGGVYRVAAAGNEGVYRFWASRTAPPASLTGLNLVTSNGMLFRGQMGGGPFATAGQWVAEHPLLTAGAIAAAIAIPIAVSDDDSGTP